LHLSPKSPIFPPLQPDHTGCGGDLQLCHIGDPGLNDPVSGDDQLTVLPYPVRPQILPLLAGYYSAIRGPCPLQGRCKQRSNLLPADLSHSAFQVAASVTGVIHSPSGRSVSCNGVPGIKPNPAKGAAYSRPPPKKLTAVMAGPKSAFMMLRLVAL